ncbi:uncharacterized protein LOC114928894 [Nylanderia fulva]|uniref:uncharacterized protein LOC114928894 n=1 Tax=Nylanderia fulva TaxID=613905 RepID=UPI0010FAF987|nr:uncharacterized protein LOC114928894 [Nylanderia fulva]
MSWTDIERNLKENSFWKKHVLLRQNIFKFEKMYVTRIKYAYYGYTPRIYISHLLHSSTYPPFSPEDIKYLCIDYVLQSKVGEDIIVNTIFHSVARRLGLRCDVLYIEDGFCIFWKSKLVTNNFENAGCFYTQKYFPGYRVIDNLSEYMSVRPFAITITKMLESITHIVRQFIMRHIINALQLIEVKCIIQKPSI